MTILPPVPADDPPLNQGSGPLVCIGLPVELAQALAENRPVVTLQPDQVETLSRLTDAVVACRLWGSKIDAMEVIANLVRAGYRGAVLVICPKVPDTQLIRTELSAAAIGMQISLIAL